MDKITIFDTAMVSENMGDEIIMEYCKPIIQDIFPNAFIISLPTHNKLSREAYRISQNSRYSIVCGTNLMTGRFERGFKTWEVGWKESRFFDEICLFGVGWWKYQDRDNAVVRKLWSRLLSHDLLHSVRDSYTESKMKEMGFSNVVNTACPTMWKLTPEFCKDIPTKKSANVVTTLTCYHRNREMDSDFLDILLQSYEKIFFWVQSPDDYGYVRSLNQNPRIQILSPSMESLNQILQREDIEYCGTRLHAGIKALNMKKRSIIIANDNRAIEISKDTNLKVVKLENVATDLEDLINTTFETRIHLPVDNINQWKKQFE